MMRLSKHVVDFVRLRTLRTDPQNSAKNTHSVIHWSIELLHTINNIELLSCNLSDIAVGV